MKTIINLPNVLLIKTQLNNIWNKLRKLFSSKYCFNWDLSQLNKQIIQLCKEAGIKRVHTQTHTHKKTCLFYYGKNMHQWTKFQIASNSVSKRLSLSLSLSLFLSQSTVAKRAEMAVAESSQKSWMWACLCVGMWHLKSVLYIQSCWLSLMKLFKNSI